MGSAGAGLSEETGTFVLGMLQVQCLLATGVVMLTRQRPVIELLPTPIAF